MVGKGKSNDTSSRAEQHTSRPLSSLKDPGSFAPPPRRSAASGTGGVGSAQRRPQEQSPAEQTQQEEAEESAARPRPPPVPYRADTTGLSTSQFAKPPGRRNESSTDQRQDTRAKPEVKPKPALPPRLPPRGSASNEPPPAYEENPTPQLNQGAVNRLGNAGVSVGQLGIGGTHGNNSRSAGPEAAHSPVSEQSNPQNELQARFAKMNTSSGSPSTATAAPSHAQDQTSQAQPNPQRSSSDLSSGGRRSTTESPGNFRERSNEHVQAGRRKLSDFDQKYGIKKRINGFIEDQKSPAYPPPNTQQQQQQQQHPSEQSQPTNTPYSAPAQNTSRPDLETLNNRKPPPPPPPPKPRSSAPAGQGQDAPSPGGPPPLPLDTKPR